MSYEPVTRNIMRISQRGQVTIPKKLRDRFGLHPNIEVEVVPTEDGLLIRTRTDDLGNGSDPIQADDGAEPTDVERILRERREQGLHPVDQIVGILGTGGNTDEYMAEIRGR
ncbi:MAG: AbrB/MazE/SpoVT family DNA-binding domain-containing protein [Chloroflexi bacterium]|nr:AbrB/MazE/SpoVT family DNA-binding domain-containing protein [Chloroflexota bacterium]